jgi:hypothetical protein
MAALLTLKMTLIKRNQSKKQKAPQNLNHRDNLIQGLFRQFLPKTHKSLKIIQIQSIQTTKTIVKTLDYRFKQSIESIKKILTLFPAMNKELKQSMTRELAIALISKV